MQLSLLILSLTGLVPAISSYPIGSGGESLIKRMVTEVASHKRAAKSPFQSHDHAMEMQESDQAATYMSLAARMGQAHATLARKANFMLADGGKEVVRHAYKAGQAAKLFFSKNTIGTTTSNHPIATAPDHVDQGEGAHEVDRVKAGKKMVKQVRKMTVGGLATSVVGLPVTLAAHGLNASLLPATTIPPLALAGYHKARQGVYHAKQCVGAVCAKVATMSSQRFQVEAR
jgi:hypothetical protein